MPGAAMRLALNGRTFNPPGKAFDVACIAKHYLVLQSVIGEVCVTLMWKSKFPNPMAQIAFNLMSSQVKCSPARQRLLFSLCFLLRSMYVTLVNFKIHNGGYGGEERRVRFQKMKLQQRHTSSHGSSNPSSSLIAKQ
jgi:hypothetical protein